MTYGTGVMARIRSLPVTNPPRGFGVVIVKMMVAVPPGLHRHVGGLSLSPLHDTLPLETEHLPAVL